MIVLENISVRVEKVYVFKNLSLELPPKTGIYGPNGSGKTILLKTIAGLIKTEKGRIIIDGLDFTKVKPFDRPITMVFQDLGLWENLEVRENLEVMSSDIKKAQKLLRFFNLDEKKDYLVQDLSGGEKQRLSIIRALLKPNYNYLLLDEPFSSLDKRSFKKFLRLIRNEKYIIVSHNIPLLKKICKRTIDISKFSLAI